MSCATALSLIEDQSDDEVDSAIDTAIVQFLYGESDGAGLFEVLYGAALDEPIPDRMLALVRGSCPTLVTDDAS